MRKFKFSILDIGETIIVSEEEIRKDYYPYWYEKMCQKFGKDVVDEQYSFEDCLEDFIVTNWAEELENEK